MCCPDDPEDIAVGPMPTTLFVNAIDEKKRPLRSPTSSEIKVSSKLLRDFELRKPLSKFHHVLHSKFESVSVSEI